MKKDNKEQIIKEIQSFLEGSNDELKYIVNIETDSNTNVAECIVHEPNHNPRSSTIVVTILA